MGNVGVGEVGFFIVLSALRAVGLTPLRCAATNHGKKGKIGNMNLAGDNTNQGEK